MQRQYQLTKFLILGFMGLLLPLNSTYAAKYYGCPGGYQFQVKSRAARCIKPAGVKKVSPMRCPLRTFPGTTIRVGTVYKVDYNRNNDKCVGRIPVGLSGNAIVLAVACPSGYSRVARRGKDECRKTTPRVITFPSKQVNR